MAFVFKSEKQTSYIPKVGAENLGPGQYQSDLSELQDQPQNSKPFNSSVERQRSHQRQKQSPGPGQYEMPSMFDNQKIIFHNEEQDIKIVEVPKPISVFRSTTVRFQEQRTHAPGPTSYFVAEERRPYKSADNHNRKRKINVIEQLMKDNQYISIPSIPSNIHQFGYTENANNRLEPNAIQKMETEQLGPGSYNLDKTSQERRRGVSWHKPSQFKEKEPTVGPGAYDITATSIPMYQMKPSTAFNSKCGRYSDIKFLTAQQQQKLKTSYVKKGLDRKEYSFQFSTKDQTMKDSDEESNYSYIDDATPGPGYYDNATTNNTIQSVILKSSVKGSLKSHSKRFQLPRTTAPGPGDYSKLEFKPPRIQGPKPPFLCQQQRLRSLTNENPPPTQYKGTANTMEDKLIQKLLRAPLGSFGVVEQRFKEKQRKIPGPGTYEMNKTEQKFKMKENAVFRSEVPKSEQMDKIGLSPPPGCYEINQHTIENKVKKIEEEDPKLAVIKPPFGCGEGWRLNEAIKEEEEDETLYVEKSPSNQFYKKAKKSPPFMSGQDRFIDNYEENPGPGDYADGTYPSWNKRTFNIIFAEI